MSRQESSNGLHLIKYASILLKGRFSSLFMGTFAMVTPLALMVIIPLIFALLFESLWILTIGIILFAIFVGPMQLGYIKYFNEVISGNQPKLYVVYSEIKFTGHAFRGMFIAILLLVMYLIGGLLWLITAGFIISFFSMTLFFLQKFKYPRITVALRECARHMIGNRLAMFSYKLIFYLMYFMLFIVGALCMALVYVISVDSLLIAWIVCVCSVIIFIFLYTMITLYFHSSNEIFFEDLLMYREKMDAKEKRLAAKNKEATEENLGEADTKNEKVEETKVENIEEKKENAKKTKSTANKKEGAKKDKTKTKSKSTKKSNKVDK